VSDAPKLRLFIAVRVPEAQLETLQKLVERMRKDVTDARWTPVENQHVTLKFLGSTREELVEPIDSVIDEIAARAAPEDVALSGFGAFPSPRRARVLWTGIEDPTALLVSMANELNGGLEALGFEPERRELTPHVTLARLRTPRSLAREIAELPPAEFPPFVVQSLDLFLSRLSPHGARYELMKAYPLRAANVHN
jgi:RNA 2',3'-cyclic 3'-phosphodiesterase